MAIRARRPARVHRLVQISQIEPRPIAVATTTKEFNGREYPNWPIKEYGLRVPRPLPPQQKRSSKQRGEQQSQVSIGQSAIDRTEAEEQ